jgi:uncharacterized alkaline shock family protein YloU
VNEGGTVTISADVLERVVRRSAEEVDGVRLRRRGVEVGDGRVEVELAVRHGLVLPEVARAVQQSVHVALRDLCGIESSVDVKVEELL